MCNDSFNKPKRLQNHAAPQSQSTQIKCRNNQKILQNTSKPLNLGTVCHTLRYTKNCFKYELTPKPIVAHCIDGYTPLQYLMKTTHDYTLGCLCVGSAAKTQVFCYKIARY